MTMDDSWTARLSEYLDGDLLPAERAGLERHLAGCAECSRTLTELRRVVSRARALDDRTPAADLWPGIAATIGSDARTVRPLRAGRRRFSFSAPQLVAAAVLLVAVSGGAAWLLRVPPTVIVAAAPAGPGRAAAPVMATPTGWNRPGQTPQQSYDAAVADLQQVLREGRGRLDSTTVRVIEKNLMTIDSAVVEARRALEKDPANSYLNSYLAHTMRRKIDLLRQVAALASAQS